MCSSRVMSCNWCSIMVHHCRQWRQPPPLLQLLLLLYLLTAVKVHAKPSPQEHVTQTVPEPSTEQFALEQFQQQHLQLDELQVQQLQLRELPPQQQEQSKLHQIPPEHLHAQTLQVQQLPSKQLQQDQPVPVQQFPIEELKQRLQSQQLHLQQQPLEQVHTQQLQLQQPLPEQQQHQPLQTPQQSPPFSPNLDGEKFRYSYSVQDPTSGGRSGHLETRNGVFSLGNYFVKMPGATQQTVNYFTDDWGYHPVVAYSTASGSAVSSTHFALGGRAVAALQHQHKIHHGMPKQRQLKEEPIPATVLVAPAAPLPPPPATLVAPAAPISLAQVNPLLVNSELPDIGENSLTSLSPPPLPETSPSPEIETAQTSSSAGVSGSDGNIINKTSLSGTPSTIRPIVVAETGVPSTDEISTSSVTPSTLATVPTDVTETATSPTVVITPRPSATSPSPQESASEAILAPLGAASSLTPLSTVPEQHLEESNYKDDYDSRGSSLNKSSKAVERMTEMIIEKSPAVFEAHYHTTVEILKSIPLDAETGKIQTGVEEQERHYSSDSVHLKNLQQVQQLQESAHLQILKQRARQQAEFERRLEEEIKNKKAQLDHLYQEISSQQDSHGNETYANTDGGKETRPDGNQEEAESSEGQSADEPTLPKPTGESDFGNRIRPLRLYTNSPFTLKLQPVNDALVRPEVGAYTLLPIVPLQYQSGIGVPKENTGVHLGSLQNVPPEFSFRQQIEDPEFQKQLDRLILAQKQIQNGQRNANHFELLNQSHRQDLDFGRLRAEEHLEDSQKHANGAEFNRYHLDLPPPPEEGSKTAIMHPSPTEQLLQELQASRIQPVLIPGENFPVQFQGISLELPQQLQLPLREEKSPGNRLAAENEQATQGEIHAPGLQQQQIQTGQNKQQLLDEERQQPQIEQQGLHQQRLQEDFRQKHVGADSLFQQNTPVQDLGNQGEIQSQRSPDETATRVQSIEESGKEQIQSEENQQSIPEPQDQQQNFFRNNGETHEPITTLTLQQQIEYIRQHDLKSTNQHQLELREQQVESELQPSNRINLEDLQQQRLETEQTRQSSYQSEYIPDRAQSTGDVSEESHRQLHSDQEHTQQILSSAEQIAEETDNHPKSENLYQQTNSDQLAETHQVENEPQITQSQINIIQLQQVPAGTEQLQILGEEHLNTPQQISREEHHHVQPGPGDSNLLQPTAPPISLSAEMEKHLQFPLAHPVDVPPAVDPNRGHTRHPSPLPTTASYAAQAQRHRETDLSHKAVPGIDFDKKVHCAERVYSYGPNVGGHPWNRNTRRANLRKLCIEYGGFKPPLVPSTPIEEDSEPVGPPPPLISSHHNVD